MVVDTTDNCYSAMIPGGQSNRPSAALLANVEKLRRWSSADPTEAYDRFCLPVPVPEAAVDAAAVASTASGVTKEEL